MNLRAKPASFHQQGGVGAPSGAAVAAGLDFHFPHSFLSLLYLFLALPLRLLFVPAPMSYLRFAFHRLKSDNKLLLFLVAPCLVGLAAVHYSGVIDCTPMSHFLSANCCTCFILASISLYFLSPSPCRAAAAQHAQDKMEAEAQVKARALRSMGIRVDLPPGGPAQGAPQGGMRR